MKAFLTRNLLITLLVIFFISIIGLWGVKDQGISSDEITEVRMVKSNLDLITTGKAKFIPDNVRYYGTIFNLTSEGVFNIYSQISKTFLGNEKIEALQQNVLKKGQGKYTLYFEKIRIKHYVTFFWVLLGYVASALLVGFLTKSIGMALTPIILSCLPRFWGHSFFNPKDAPFASFFTVCSLFGALLISLYFNEETQKNNKKILIYSAIYGILIGLLSGIRIGGILALSMFIITHVLINFQRGNRWQDILSLWKSYLVIFCISFITITLIHPAAWSNPFKWLFESLRHLSKHSWSGTNLFNSQFILASSSPWYYVPQWLMMTTPVFILLMCLAGIVLGVINYKNFDEKQKACFILVILQASLLPMIAIVRQSTVYDGIRQFLFVFPAISILATYGIIKIYQAFPKKIYQYFCITIVVTSLAAIIIDMIQLHPYEYIYFNRLVNGLAGVQDKFETDYWGLSMREGMEWINNHAEDGDVVISSPELHSSKMFAKPNIPVADYNSYEKSLKLKKWDFPSFYYIAKPRWDYQQKLPECPKVYAVTRQEVELTIVKKCSKPSS